MSFKLLLWSLFLLLSLTRGTSCKTQTDKINKTIAHLDIDSIYRSPEEKIKYHEMKMEFEKIWLDTGNCYTSDFRVDPKYPDEFNFKQILNYRIDNILHSPNYDTVAVIVSFYAAWIEKDGSKDGEITKAKLMKAVIDENCIWNFDCKMNNFSFYDNGDKIEKTLKNFKRMIISSGYLDENGKTNSNYLLELFSKELDFD
ncbi:MAG: hypothetical protein M3Q58_14385 [Bacteroidota bacterium]|nr:hypothetical protein [Bacteroidota bacterium]